MLGLPVLVVLYTQMEPMRTVQNYTQVNFLRACVLPITALSEGGAYCPYCINSVCLCVSFSHDVPFLIDNLICNSSAISFIF